MPSLFLIILVFSLSFPHPTSPLSTTTTLPLSPTPPPPTDPWQKLSHLSAASTARAHHLKHPRTNTSSSAANVPLSPHSYGGYSISLTFGSPPQPLPFVMDTGSSLVWFPCTRRYSCTSCNSDPPVFIPKSSSSSRLVGCKNPKCNWIFPTVQCRDCPDNNNSTTACNQTCPPYVIEYGSGSTTGLLLSESLILPGHKPLDNFLVGCSVFSTRMPAGIAGFGRGPQSLPSQMGLARFSYCLVSHRFDDNTTQSSDLVLSGGGAAAAEYTPFRKNPTSSNPAFQDYYYVTLRKITVGGVNVKAPYKFLVADADGNGGAIVDSGTTFTFMEEHVFELVARELEKQVGSGFSRAVEVESQSGLRPCFNVSGDGENSLSFPQLTFHFKGGAEMVLPLADYFSFLDDSAICMTIVTNSGTGGEVGPGPAIILGNYQQQNFYMEYDLENDRLGFQKQLCK